MKKVSVISPANIAFIKYWGRADHNLYIPRNSSISMNISGCKTTTTIALSDKKEDEVYVKFFNQKYQQLNLNTRKAQALLKQIVRIRQISENKSKVKIFSENNFPADAGIASSASSFSALTAGLLLIYGLQDKFADKIELSRQIRLCGSGSAVRSAMDGFVEFTTGNDQTSHAVQIADQNHWDLVDIVALIDFDKKKISSSLGHELADTSPYFETRITEMQSRIKQCREAIIKKDLEKLGMAIEQDAISMHAVMMTSRPPAFYWQPGSMAIIQAIISLRESEKIPAYFTFDAGANAHIITEAKYLEKVNQYLQQIPFVKNTIINHPDLGVREINKHLF